MYLQQCSPAQCRLITQIIDASDIQNKDIEEQYEQKRIKNLAFSYDLNIPLACKWLRKYHGITISICETVFTKAYYWKYHDIEQNTHQSEKDYQTYEMAEYEGLEHILIMLRLKNTSTK